MKVFASGQERVLATNPLFEPFLVEQYDAPGIHEMIFQSMFKCSVDLRRAFAENIILSGGKLMTKPQNKMWGSICHLNENPK